MVLVMCQMVLVMCRMPHGPSHVSDADAPPCQALDADMSRRVSDNVAEYGRKALTTLLLYSSRSSPLRPLCIPSTPCAVLSAASLRSSLHPSLQPLCIPPLPGSYATLSTATTYSNPLCFSVSVYLGCL